MNCKECDSIVTLIYSKLTNEKMEEKQLCFSCNFWQEFVEYDRPEPRYIIEGEHYIVLPEEPRTSLRGYGGKKFTIETDNGSILFTTNLWHQGTVPEHFRDRLPNNAKFIK
jgi:hypothetical protein